MSSFPLPNSFHVAASREVIPLILGHLSVDSNRREVALLQKLVERDAPGNSLDKNHDLRMAERGIK